MKSYPYSSAKIMRSKLRFPSWRKWMRIRQSEEDRETAEKAAEQAKFAEFKAGLQAAKQRKTMARAKQASNVLILATHST